MDYGSLGSTLEQTAGLASITGYEGGQPLMSNETFPDPVVGILTVGALMAALRVRLRTGKGRVHRPVAAGGHGGHDRRGVPGLRHERTSGRACRQPASRSRAPGRLPLRGRRLVGRGERAFRFGMAGTVRGDGPVRTGRRRPACNRRGPARTPRGDRRGRCRVDTRARPLPGHAPASGSGRAGGRGSSKAARLSWTRIWRRGGFWDTVEHPEAGEYRQVTTPWQMSRSRRIHAAPAPGLGEHNALVLGDLLGLPATELEALERQGIIGTRPVGAD